MTRTTRTISALTTTLGALILLTTVGAGVWPVSSAILTSIDTRSQGGTLPATDISRVEVYGSSDVVVRFDDVEEVSLHTSDGGTSSWRLSTSGSTLVVSNSARFGPTCFLWCPSEEAVLTLPRMLDEQGLGEVSQVEALSVGDIAVKSPPYLKEPGERAVDPSSLPRVLRSRPRSMRTPLTY